MTTPKIGQYLFASCSASDYGRIVAVGRDENGADTIDILVTDPQDLIDCEHDPDTPRGWIAPLTTVEFPPGDVVLRGVQWRTDTSIDGYIVCNTPGDGCFRCTKLFELRDGPARS
jgi:hypothetical protein